MFVVNRKSFIAWTNGVLLSRGSDGSVTIGDDVKNEKAMEMLKKGSVVHLEQNGAVISSISLKDGAYVEERL